MQRNRSSLSRLGILDPDHEATELDDVQKKLQQLVGLVGKIEKDVAAYFGEGESASAPVGDDDALDAEFMHIIEQRVREEHMKLERNRAILERNRAEQQRQLDYEMQEEIKGVRAHFQEKWQVAQLDPLFCRSASGGFGRVLHVEPLSEFSWVSIGEDGYLCLWFDRRAAEEAAAARAAESKAAEEAAAAVAAASSAAEEADRARAEQPAAESAAVDPEAAAGGTEAVPEGPGAEGAGGTEPPDGAADSGTTPSASRPASLVQLPVPLNAIPLNALPIPPPVPSSEKPSAPPPALEDPPKRPRRALKTGIMELVDFMDVLGRPLACVTPMDSPRLKAAADVRRGIFFAAALPRSTTGIAKPSVPGGAPPAPGDESEEVHRCTFALGTADGSVHLVELSVWERPLPPPAPPPPELEPEPPTPGGRTLAASSSRTPLKAPGTPGAPETPARPKDTPQSFGTPSLQAVPTPRRPARPQKEEALPPPPPPPPLRMEASVARRVAAHRSGVARMSCSVVAGTLITVPSNPEEATCGWSTHDLSLSWSLDALMVPAAAPTPRGAAESRVGAKTPTAAAATTRKLAMQADGAAAMACSDGIAALVTNSGRVFQISLIDQPGTRRLIGVLQPLRQKHQRLVEEAMKRYQEEEELAGGGGGESNPSTAGGTAAATAGAGAGAAPRPCGIACVEDRVFVACSDGAVRSFFLDPDSVDLDGEVPWVEGTPFGEKMPDDEGMFITGSARKIRRRHRKAVSSRMARRRGPGAAGGSGSGASSLGAADAGRPGPAATAAATAAAAAAEGDGRVKFGGAGDSAAESGPEGGRSGGEAGGTGELDLKGDPLAGVWIDAAGGVLVTLDVAGSLCVWDPTDGALRGRSRLLGLPFDSPQDPKPALGLYDEGRARVALAFESDWFLFDVAPSLQAPPAPPAPPPEEKPPAPDREPVSASASFASLAPSDGGSGGAGGGVPTLGNPKVRSKRALALAPPPPLPPPLPTSKTRSMADLTDPGPGGAGAGGAASAPAAGVAEPPAPATAAPPP
eukprot:tig00000459_g1075.t1